MAGSAIGNDALRPVAEIRAGAAAAIDEGRPVAALGVLAPLLETGPDDPDLLALAATAARMAGRIEDARRLARQAARLRGDAAAHVLATALGGQPRAAAAASDAGSPVPFVLLDAALSRSDRDAIWDEAFGDYAAFTPATVIDDAGRYADDAVRSSRLLETAAGSALSVVDRVRADAPRAAAAFGLDAVPRGHAEVQVTWHGNGDFFRCHQDRPNERVESIDGRRLSFVYYLTRTPRRFSGGDLRLYDWRRDGETWRSDRWTLITPEDNRLILFPSEAFHEVMPIALDSDDPEDGRLTVNGWIHVG